MTKEELQQQENELLNLLSENRNKQKELNKKEFVNKHGADIGDTVTYMDGYKAKRGIIKDVEFYGTTPYYYIATLFNSDGKLGKMEARIFINDTLTVTSKATN